MTTNSEVSEHEKVEEVIHLPSELPSGWAKLSLAEVAEIIMGQSPSSEYYNAEGNGLPFFQGKAEFGDLYPEAVKWCSVPGKIAQKDDVLISVRAPVGPTNLAPSECCIGRGLAAIRPRNGIPAKYVLHYLRSIERDIDALGTGTTFKAISGKTLREIPVPIAPPDQQKHIVAEIEKQFSRLDEAVANLKRVKANLKRYKAAVLKAAVEGRLVETEAEIARREGRSFEAGAQLLQRILETRRSQWQGKGKYKEPAAPDTTNLPELPQGWVWATMPQLGELARGKSKHRPRDDAKLYGGPYPFIQTGDVRRSEGTIAEHTQTYSDIGLAQSRLWPHGTLCITIAANIAETGILNFASCFPDSIVGFIASSDQVAARYVELFIRTAKGGLERFAPATAQKNINLEVLEAVAIALPPIGEQRRIVAEVERRLSLLREAEAQVNANLQRPERLRQSILKNAFSSEGHLCES